MALVSTNPATGRVIARYRRHARADIERRVDAAARAQRRWSAVPLAERGERIASLGRVLRQQADTLAALATAEMGKPIRQARGEVEKCAVLCDYYAAHAAEFLATHTPPHAPAGSQVRFDPLGVILAIMPWNFPYWQLIRAAVPALATGNTVLLKHAPTVIGCALALERAFAAAGFPRGCFSVLQIDTRPVPGLIHDPRIQGVTLTGSTRAGQAVAAEAGAAMKPGVFELGGSDPLIVLDDADLDHAAACATESRLINSGQSCICAKRLIVARSVRKPFEERLLERFRQQRVGDPTDPTTDIGPLARRDLRNALHAQVEASVKRGAKLLLGGSPLSGRGFYYAPTVLAVTGPGIPVFDEETLGPVACLVSARDDAHALQLANATPFGLGAAIFSRDVPRAQRLAGQLEAGCVFINDYVRSSPELPFGGVKQSGFGRELGPWGLHSFANIKTVVARA